MECKAPQHASSATILTCCLVSSPNRSWVSCARVSGFTGLSPGTMAQIPTRQRILASQNLWKHEGLVTTQKGTASSTTSLPHGPPSHGALRKRVSIYRLISRYNGSDSNTSAHTRFAKHLETRRISHYPETYSIIHHLSRTWSAKPWNLSLTVSSRGNAPPTSSWTQRDTFRKERRDRNCN